MAEGKDKESCVCRYCTFSYNKVVISLKFLLLSNHCDKLLQDLIQGNVCSSHKISIPTPQKGFLIPPLPSLWKLL